MALSVDIEKKLGAFRLSVSFETGDGVLALLGASGCGKSMTLKCIAGIETPDRGRIVLDGVTLFDAARGINLAPQQRRVGYLFQQYALFPNMTVWKNIACGVRDKRGADETVREIIAAMHLEGCEHKRPHQLSGGQQQRVALARILVNQPNLLLLDEPFSALDSHLRFRTEQEVRRIIRTFGKTVLLVSHDRDEVYRLSDEIAVMGQGRIDVCGPRERIFADPQTRNAAVLTGCKNISRIEMTDEFHARALDWEVELTLPRPCAGAAYAGIRMHDICLAADGIPCSVTAELENPFSYTVMLRPHGSESATPIGWEVDKETWRACRAETLRIALPPAHILLLRGEELP